jgi:hypothetical protein
MRDPERRTVFTGTGSHIPARRVPNEDFLDHRCYLDYGAPCDPADNPRMILPKTEKISPSAGSIPLAVIRSFFFKGTINSSGGTGGA